MTVGVQYSEMEEQVALMARAEDYSCKVPELQWLHHIPNGGDRDIRVAAQLKRAGVRAGVPDLFLPVPRGEYHGLYIELKRVGGKHPEGRQRECIAFLREQGYRVEVCFGHKAAWAALEDYLGLDMPWSFIPAPTPRTASQVAPQPPPPAPVKKRRPPPLP
jgi:hypothetical protein